MRRYSLKKAMEPSGIACAMEEQWFALFILLLTALALNLGQPLRLDDAAFMRMYAKDGPDLWIWAQEYWTTWSGRVLPHAVFVVLMNMSPTLVNVINALMQTACVYLTGMYIFRNPAKRSGLSWSILLVLIMGFFYLGTEQALLEVSVFWKTAAVLYVWGYAAMLFALYPMLKLYLTGDESSIFMWILSGCAAVYAAGFEQSGGFFAAMGLILVLAYTVRTKTISWPAIIVWGVGTVFTFFFIMSPGNFIRYSEEILFWFPDFGLLSRTDRLFLGISYTLRYCLTDLFLPVFMTAVGTFVIICLNKRNVIIKAAAFLPVAYYGLYHIYKVPFLYDYAFPDSVQGFTALNWSAVFFGIFHVFLLTILLFMYIDDRLDPVTSAFYAGGLAESVIMGYTPTIIVSMSRCIFFCREILMVPMFYVVYKALCEAAAFAQKNKVSEDVI
ncbi:MAG: hypothetical protein IKF10_04235 [Lachnospiraceae bacterium]|nr:hypothetical protein [Lachnospiraceae bacterium]